MNGLFRGLDRVIDWVSQGVAGCLVAVAWPVAVDRPVGVREVA